MRRKVSARRDPLHQVREPLPVRQHRLDMAPGERDGDTRNAEHHRLHRCRHGTGVQHVLAHVRAVVHAGEAEVGRVGHQRFDREHDAVRRGAVHLERAVGAAGGPEWAMQGERVRGTALLSVGGDHGHLADLAARIGEQGEPGGEDAVVVGDENVHG